MALSPEEAKIFSDTYDRCVTAVVHELREWKVVELEIMREQNIEGANINFTDFAKESVLHAMNKIHERYYAEEAAIQTAKRIIEGDE